MILELVPYYKSLISSYGQFTNRFDKFYFYRQGALLAADTFGSSHILPVFGLPLLVTAAAVGTSSQSNSYGEDSFFSLEVSKVSY